MASNIQVLMSNRKIRNFHIMGFNVIRLNGLFSSIYHNKNTPMQYTAIFHGCKLYFQMKNCNVLFIFLNKKIRKINTHVNPSFTI